MYVRRNPSLVPHHMGSGFSVAAGIEATKLGWNPYPSRQGARAVLVARRLRRRSNRDGSLRSVVSVLRQLTTTIPRS